MLECWNIGYKSGNKRLKLSKIPSNPLFHYSIIPLFQLGRSTQANFLNNLLILSNSNRDQSQAKVLHLIDIESVHF